MHSFLLQVFTWTTTTKKGNPKGSVDDQIRHKRAFLHIPIKEAFKRYLIFKYKCQLYFYKALPFGLTLAPYTFTRIVKYPVAILCQRGIQVLAYMNDIMLWAVQRTESGRHSNSTSLYCQTRVFHKLRKVHVNSIPRYKLAMHKLEDRAEQ